MKEKVRITESELKILKEIQRNEKNKRDYIKVTVLIMSYSGFDIRTIEEMLGIDTTSIYRYISLYNKEGLNKYLGSNYQGYIGRLSYIELSGLIKEVEGNFFNDSKEICELVEKKYGVKYTSRGMVNLLRRIGFVYKKTTQDPCKYDIEEQKKFVRKFYERNNNLKETESIYYSDAVHPQHNTKTSYCWIKKGEEKEIKSVSGRQRININGLLNANDVTDIITITSNTINYQSTIELYKKLLDLNQDKEKIYVICDNARYYKNKELKKWLEDTKIVQIFLPPYSPNLNIIERLWKFLKNEVINSTFYRTFAEFKNGISNFFNNIENYQDELKTLLTNKFHIKTAN